MTTQPKANDAFEERLLNKIRELDYPNENWMAEVAIGRLAREETIREVLGLLRSDEIKLEFGGKLIDYRAPATFYADWLESKLSEKCKPTVDGSTEKETVVMKDEIFKTEGEN